MTTDDTLTHPPSHHQAATLVLLHGVTGDGRSHFGHLADRFADHHRVILPDYAGSGTSTLPDGP